MQHSISCYILLLSSDNNIIAITCIYRKFVELVFIFILVCCTNCVVHILLNGCPDLANLGFTVPYYKNIFGTHTEQQTLQY